MSKTFRSFLTGGSLVLAALLTVSPAFAQPSPLGHVAARGSRPLYSPGGSTFQIYPGDKGFNSTMQIQRYYQVLERSRVQTSRPPAFSTSAVETSPGPNTIVKLNEHASQPLMVTLRGPDGKLRSFPVEGGQKAIQPRTIVVRPGERLTISIGGARVTIDKKR